MKSYLISLVVLLSVSTASVAETADTRASVEKMFELTDMPKMMDAIYQQMDQVYAQMAGKREVSQEQQPIYDKYRARYKEMIQESMSWDAIKEPIIEAYARVYTKEEVDALIVFYDSPVGHKMLEKTPELMQVTMQLMQKVTAEMMPKMQALQKEMTEELKASS